MEKKAKRIQGLPEPEGNFESATQRIMSRGYVKVSENISVRCGVIPSVVLGVLINACDHDARYYRLPPDGSFSISIGEIRNRTGITKKTAYKAIETLANNGLIEYDAGKVGEPYSRRYYRLNEDAIKRANSGDAIEQNDTTPSKNDLWQNDTTPLVQNDTTPMVERHHPYGKMTPHPWCQKTPTIYRSIEADIEAPIEGEKGDGFAYQPTDQKVEASQHPIEPMEAVEGETTSQQGKAATAAGCVAGYDVMAEIEKLVSGDGDPAAATAE